MTPVAFWLIAALLLQGAIALVLLWILGMVRVPMVVNGKVRLEQVAVSREPWPEDEKRVSNAFDNQFQLPLLFYVACGLALYFGPIWFEALLAWLFVLTRIVHAWIFASSNNVVRRFWAYTIGYGLLGVFWVDLAVRLVLNAVGAR